MPTKKTTTWDKLKTVSGQHKLAAGSLVLVALILVLGLGAVAAGRLAVPLSPGPDSVGHLRAPSGFAPEAADQTASAPREIEVQEGDLTIKSDQADADQADIRSVTEQFDGYVETSRRSETPTHLRLFLTVRLPAENFDQFFNYLRNNFKVENYNLTNYRLDLERATDELAILDQAFADYSSIREDIQVMATGEEKIALLMKLTETELELAGRQRAFLREVTQVQRRGDLSTVTITIEERLRPTLWPDNIGAEFWADLAAALENIVGRTTDIVTGGLILFITVIQYLIFALVAIIPVWLVGRLVWRYRKWWYE